MPFQVRTVEYSSDGSPFRACIVDTDNGDEPVTPWQVEGEHGTIGEIRTRLQNLADQMNAGRNP